MKRIIKREGLPKVVQIVSPSDDAVRETIQPRPLSLAGALGKRRLVRRVLRVSKSDDPGGRTA